MARKTRQEKEIDAIDRGESAWRADDEVIDIEVAPRPRATVIAPVRIPSDKWNELRKEADELGVGVSTLIRMWVLERLRKRRAKIA